MEGGEVIVDNVASFLEFLGSIVTQVISWMTEVLTFITTNPVILVPMLMFFVVGGVIGLITRLIRA